MYLGAAFAEQHCCALQASARASRDRAPGVVEMLAGDAPDVLKASLKQLRNKSLKTRTGILHLLKELLATLPDGQIRDTDQLLPGVLAAIDVSVSGWSRSHPFGHFTTEWRACSSICRLLCSQLRRLISYCMHQECYESGNSMVSLLTLAVRFTGSEQQQLAATHPGPAVPGGRPHKQQPCDVAEACERHGRTCCGSGR